MNFSSVNFSSVLIFFSYHFFSQIPTLTLAQQRLGQRIGAALVTHSAASELIARTKADYVAIARVLCHFFIFVFPVLLLAGYVVIARLR